jgi:hypothetical protein
LPEGYWAIITTLVIVTQPSLTQAIGTARDQIVGAFIGGIVGMLGVLAIEHGATPLAVFAIALVPLAALAAERPAWRLACITLVIVVLIPVGTGPYYQRPLHRLLEILIGAASAYIVTIALPNRALRRAHHRVAEALRSLGQLVGLHLSGNDDAARVSSLEAQSTSAQQALDDALQEAQREHIIVPLQRGGVDAIDKAAPFLRRLHSDTLFLAKAVARDDRAACALRFHDAAQAMQTVFSALADALDAMHANDAQIERVHTALVTLKAALQSLGADDAHDVARFVVKLTSIDLEAFCAALYPERAAASA